jgi:hypothetical protein
MNYGDKLKFKKYIYSMKIICKVRWLGGEDGQFRHNSASRT